jgi:hypothetical protein
MTGRDTITSRMYKTRITPTEVKPIPADILIPPRMFIDPKQVLLVCAIRENWEMFKSHQHVVRLSCTRYTLMYYVQGQCAWTDNYKV